VIANDFNVPENIIFWAKEAGVDVKIDK